MECIHVADSLFPLREQRDLISIYLMMCCQKQVENAQMFPNITNEMINYGVMVIPMREQQRKTPARAEWECIFMRENHFYLPHNDMNIYEVDPHFSFDSLFFCWMNSLCLRPMTEH